MKYFLVVFCFIFSGISGQVKIGEISIDSATAKKYFLDCYLHPDTIRLKEMWENKDKQVITKNSSMLLTSFSFTLEEEREEQLMVNEYNAKIKSIAISEILDTEYHAEWVDTVYNKFLGRLLGGTGISKKQIDSMNYRNKQIEIKSGIKEIKTYPAYTWIRHTKMYLVARKPSEIDFINWYAKTATSK